MKQETIQKLKTLGELLNNVLPQIDQTINDINEVDTPYDIIVLLESLSEIMADIINYINELPNQ